MLFNTAKMDRRVASMFGIKLVSSARQVEKRVGRQSVEESPATQRLQKAGRVGRTVVMKNAKGWLRCGAFVRNGMGGIGEGSGDALVVAMHMMQDIAQASAAKRW